MKSLLTIHPGEVLLKQFLAPRGISRNALARSTGLSPGRISDIVLGRRDVALDSDERLASALGTDKCFWLELQAKFDLAGKGAGNHGLVLYGDGSCLPHAGGGIRAGWRYRQADMVGHRHEGIDGGISVITLDFD